MLAYHNDPELKKSVVTQMAAHRKADELVKGRYWENGKGCAVGCLIKSNDYMLYEMKFGIPVALARLKGIFFKNLQNKESQKWPERFLKAIRPGADLSLVQWKFLHWLQKENLKGARKAKMSPNVISTIKQCVDVLAPMTKGKRVDDLAAEAAFSAAIFSAVRSAVNKEERSAVRSAAEAVWLGLSGYAVAAACSAVWSAELSGTSHWVKMADKLIELLEAA